MSSAYLVLLVLLLTGALLSVLMLPLPSFGTRILLGFLHKLNSPLLFWPTRIIVGFVLISFVFSITEMQKYEGRLEELHTDGLARKDLLIQKWRRCLVVFLTSSITWGVQNVVYTNHKLYEELTKLQSSPKTERKQKVA